MKIARHRAPNVAVLITCHNRREKTMRCLDAVFRAESAATLRVYVVDDGSTDGTSEEISTRHPQVELIAGSGDLFWCRGMERAWRAALPERFDGYLWLNDDVDLFDGSLERLFQVVGGIEQSGPWPAVVVGSTADPGSGVTTYGGNRMISSWHPGKLDRVEPDACRVQMIDTFNGNIVYVPADVVDRIGIIDGAFSHATGDSDYGLRARRAGIAVILAPGHFGYCERNLKVNHSPRTIFSRKGLPWRDWFQYTRRHGGCGLWIVAFVGPYVRVTVRGVGRATALAGRIRNEGKRTKVYGE